MSEAKKNAPKKQRSHPPTWIVLLIGGLLGWILHPDQEAGMGGSDEHQHAGANAEAEIATTWTCSMHPQIQFPEFGLCPLCKMDLIPLLVDSSGDMGPTELKMSATAVALAEITTTPVRRLQVAHEVSMVGKIAYDQTRQASIPAWFAGRIDRVYVDSTGVPVKAGDHLVDLYSPDLYSAEKEYLEARKGDARLASAAKGRLRLLGMSEKQIQQLEEHGKPNESETVHATIDGIVVHKNALLGRFVKEGEDLYQIADLSKVWLELDAYETDLPWLRYGQEVDFDVTGWPGETFHGRIALISPILDERTRSIRVRVHVDNQDGRLRPGMFVRAQIQSTLTSTGRVIDPELADLWLCSMHPEVQLEWPGECPACGMDLVLAEELGFVATSEEEIPLVIPATAPLLTGKRALVYVRLPGKEPHFQGREVVLGPRAGEFFVVREGLSEGELVVNKGAFRIDAELQLTGKSSMMSPDGIGGLGHEHGDMGPQFPHEMEFSAIVANDEFRQKLGALALAYVKVQVALAADDFPGAQAAASGMESPLQEVPHNGVEGEGHETWMELHQTLQESAQALANASDMAAARIAFEPLSGAMIEAVQRFGTNGAGQLRLSFCPMAFDDKGADWLQLGDDIRNPYFGSEMLMCGEVIVTLEEE